MNYQERLSDWMKHASSETREELSGLATEQLEDRFYTELAFGTAGLRGVIGAGTNRMNTYVVRRATQGLCNSLSRIPHAKERGVVIAYDSRRFSQEFALETALVCAQNGIHAYLFDSLRAVPQLSFAVRHLNCIAGVVITASHNPAKYNGYKVYWEHGGQAGPAQASAILEEINRLGYFEIQAMPQAQALAAGLLTMIGTQVDEAYYAATLKLLPNPALLREKGDLISIVYTPLHGAGNIPVRTLLGRAGLKNVHVVPEQEQPDPAFPTVSAPNPEDPNAFTLAQALADKVGANVILATDPDSDRLGMAVRKKDGAFMLLTGNQIGCLLLNYLLNALEAQNKLPERAFVAKSIVSTSLADEICARHGVVLENVLTGFRFISEKIDEAERSHSRTFLFGFEESYGFLVGTVSRDKDAISSALLAAELCVYYAARGMTLYDALQEMHQQYGCYKEGVKSYTLEGKVGMVCIASAMQALRDHPPASFAGVRVIATEDYFTRRRTDAPDGMQTPLDLPSSDMIRFLLTGGPWVTVRPSGTEPKLKLYIGASAKSEPEVDDLLQCLMADADALLSASLYNSI